MSWLDDVAELDCCDVTSTGRVTGRPHRIEIWFGVLRDTMYLISGNGPKADWYRNMLADPEVTVHLPDGEHVGRARDVTDPDERRRCGDLMGEKYVWNGDPSIGLTYEAWCYEVPAIAIEFPAAAP